ncbi:hypothetical protein SNE35_05755 [Paucibacter sp. R3-3]|uniref:Transposase DDE domain-containing protein n=1 Tax=Roseateles agri TaxID=3098619 RepID=A0ABU5DFR9_9BURK|nr:hypothetical protein [Paucibacter sp. R3-3]MDY0743997.1 hypothetical protein [Paucibacter sp. R3-3]
MALIPTRKNVYAWGLNNRSVQVRTTVVAAWRGFWKCWRGGHRRSLIETTMRCLEQLGELLIESCFECRVLELHVRLALLNLFARLGTPVTVPVV